MTLLFEPLTPQRDLICEVLRNVWHDLRAGDPEAWGRLVDINKVEPAILSMSEMLQHLCFGKVRFSDIYFPAKAWQNLKKGAESRGITMETAGKKLVAYVLAWINRDLDGFTEWVDRSKKRKPRLYQGESLLQRVGKDYGLPLDEGTYGAISEPKQPKGSEKRVFDPEDILEALANDRAHLEAALGGPVPAPAAKLKAKRREAVATA